MTTRKQCFDYAQEHNLAVGLEAKQKYHEVNLPEGYQITEHDERTGLCMSLKQVASLQEVYSSLWQDLTYLVSQKPWYKK